MGATLEPKLGNMMPLRPYPGMRPFTKEEWPIFFGRERMVDEVVAKLISQQVVFVHGDSGCGKSSLVRAGVLARLEQSGGGVSWRTQAALPRQSPLWNIAKALARLAGDGDDELQLLDWRRILNFGRGAPEAIAKRLAGRVPNPCCLLIDQFEELFEHARLCGPDDARLLTETLIALNSAPPRGLYIIITMRSEYLGACASYVGLAELVNATQYLLPRMGYEDILRAIREPAELYDGQVSRELAARLVADSKGGQDQLPLIQHGLMQLYLTRAVTKKGPWKLELSDFPGEGGLAGLVSGHADEVAAQVESLPTIQEHERLLENLFSALTDINIDGKAIRRPQSLGNLSEVTGVDYETLRIVVDAFRADGVSFLSPYGNAPLAPEDLVDVSHEAFIRCWGVLSDPADGWLIREFRNGQVWRSLLAEAELFEADETTILPPTIAYRREEWMRARNSFWAKRYGGDWERVQRLISASKRERYQVVRKQAGDDEFLELPSHSALSSQAFIVRPFGIKDGVNFEEVERLLIQPALAAAGIRGRTTTQIAEQGNIREDMFRLLVTADLVIADLSIHNANVFYELGVRHGLRPNATFLLRADIAPYPFDLETDRYLAYDARNPAAQVALLARALRATVDSGRTDSPVYQLLPGLQPPDPATLRVVPAEFREAVAYAREAGARGDLRLLAHEARDFDWTTEGLRVVGRAQFQIGARQGARETFEWLLDHRPGDVEANTRLASLYQRLGDLVRSDQAIRRVLDAALPGQRDRADAYALLGRNAKARWLARWRDKPDADARPTALHARELDEAIELYADGFRQSLNHYYSGLNALSLMAIRKELAQALPVTWAERFDTDEEAARQLDAGKARFEQLAGAVQWSLAAARRLLEHQPDDGEALWTGISECDFALLTSRRPGSVGQLYRDTLFNAPGFALSSVADQLSIFQRLGVRSEFVAQAMAVVNELGAPATTAAAQSPIARLLLFTGHMVDAEGRATPRFPRTESAEAAARAMIRKAVEDERRLEPGRMLGIAGGACGGDILFHEVCAELGIETQLYLALPQPDLCVHSVRQGGPGWIERYNRLCQRIKPRVLAESEELPRWLAQKKDYSIWQRNNLWMLFNALALDVPTLTLIALWDQGRADGPGGTEDLINQVNARGLKCIRLAAEELKVMC